MARYNDDPLWADIVPLPTDEGGSNPLAAIAYSEEYGETMSYLRAVMAADEYSERTLSLTEDLIKMNPAHYTVWLYRAKILFALQKDLRIEIDWLNNIALNYQKNYQIWHHRNLMVNRLGDCTGETAFIERMFGLDAKNYHVWSYRQWLVKRFDLWDQDELEFTERMLTLDVRNNSAWNHRWYVINGRTSGTVPMVASDAVIKKREIDFARAAIAKAPQNQSAWNYIQAIARKSEEGLKSLQSVAEEYADLSKADGIRSSHALDILADILSQDEHGKGQAVNILDLLAESFDPIRRNYWQYRKSLIDTSSVAAVSAA